jgi:hypothetical protein
VAGRPEDKTLALFENVIAAAVGIRERAWLAANVMLDDRVLAMQELAEIHEYAEWLRKEILNAKRQWCEKGQPDIV